MDTVADIYKHFISHLNEEYGIEEAEQVTILAFEQVLNYRRIDITINRDKQLSANVKGALLNILEELCSGRPIQYILGYAWFYGLKLLVNRHVLIPRRETEELVHWVVKDIQDSRILPDTILDICTGSGCIALALKKEFPLASVLAIDNSVDALDVAQQNADRKNLKIDFMKMDALNLFLNIMPSIIISNPPYVLESEKKQLSVRVREHEPSSALFVPANDPLIFYRRIGSWAFSQLPKDGKLYFEINEQMGEEISELLNELGFSRIDFKKDFQGKIRMFRAIK